MSSLSLDFSPASVDLAKLNTWLPVVPTKKHPGVLVIPPFSIINILWLDNVDIDGASYIITQFPGVSVSKFALKMPIKNKPSVVNFCPCIRWTDSDGVIQRYKLWENVGEDLDYSLYAGQTIETQFVIEIWNIRTSTTVSLDNNLSLYTSIVVLPQDCCDQVNVVFILLTEACELFDQFPLCRGSKFYFTLCIADYLNSPGIGAMVIEDTFIVGDGTGGLIPKVCPVVAGNYIVDELDNRVVDESDNQTVWTHS